MKILYDYSAFVLQARGGVSRVLFEMARHVAKQPGVECRIFAGLHRNQYIRDASAADRKMITGWYVPQKFGKQRLLNPINKLIFKVYAKRFDPDICHHTYFQTPPVPDHCKRVFTMHDMIHEIYPEMYKPDDPHPLMKKNAIKKCDGIVCISENTKSDLARCYDIQGVSVTVIHHGNSFDNVKVAEVIEDNKYLLYVGVRWIEYKNFNIVLDVLSQFKNVDLICFGGGEITATERNDFNARGISGRVRHVSGSDEVLSGYYAHAEALIYPSLYEGFGLPPVEAMHFGCPVISSSSPPMPEILGNAALFFDPADRAQLLYCIEEILDEDVRKKFIDAGYRKASSYNWEHVAKEAVAFYSSLCDAYVS